MTECKKLIIIMGVQRSGTTVLFEILANTPGITACGEAASDEIYDDFFLRPEKETREALHKLSGTILLKPVRESERRTPLAVAEEYHDYDLKIIWLYRDPVNVYHSYSRLGWSGKSLSDIIGFSQQWRLRNRDAIANAQQLGRRMIVVCYEDLVMQPDLIIMLATDLGIQAPRSIHMRKDSGEGRRSLPPTTQLLIDGSTKRVQNMLMKQRSILPTAKGIIRVKNPLARLQERISTRRHLATKAWGTEQPHPGIFPEQSIQALLDSNDVASLYRRWRVDGAIRREPGSGALMAVGFEVCQLIHNASRSLTGFESQSWKIPGHNNDRYQNLEVLMQQRRADLQQDIAQELQAACNRLPTNAAISLIDSLAEVTERIAQIWLALPPHPTGELLKLLQGVVQHNDSAWNSLRCSLEKSGLLAELLQAGLLKPDDVRLFVEDTCLPLLALSVLVENTLAALKDRPDVLERLRKQPELTRNAVEEAQRLMPLLLSSKRRLVRQLTVQNLLLPAESTVLLLHGAANRDPEAFPEPDTFRLDRCGPTPFVFEHGSSPLSRLNNDPRPGFDHLALDVAAEVITELLSQHGRLQTTRGAGTMVHYTADGSYIQAVNTMRLYLGSQDHQIQDES